jgi:hypothetical protein
MSTQTESGAPLAAPNAGELDVYSVLYAERQGENRPLRLKEVFERVCQRRREFNEQEPALTTVSTHLRSLLEKGLAEETTPGAASRPGLSTRGSMTPPTRSPNTSYRALHTPGEVLMTTYQGLAAAYPDKLEALIDFGAALGLSEEAMKQLRKLVSQERPR